MTYERLRPPGRWLTLVKNLESIEKTFLEKDVSNPLHPQHPAWLEHREHPLTWHPTVRPLEAFRNSAAP